MRSKRSRSASRTVSARSLRVLREARRLAPGIDHRRDAVPSPVRLGRFERAPEPDGDQRILQRHPPPVVGVDVAGGDAGDAERLGELGEPAVSDPVPAPERPLQLDPEVVGAERPGEAAAEPGGEVVLPACDPPRERAVARAA